jgi:hypothetical protein
MDSRNTRLPLRRTESISNVYSLSELFAIPLKAVVDANAYAVKTALDFLFKYAFSSPVARLRDSNDFIGSLRTVTFTYDYTDTRGQRQVTKVSVPFISLIPIPLLEVTKAHFDYAIQILNQERQLIGESSDNITVENKSLLAVLAPMDSTQKSRLKIARESGFKANMTVHIEVEKSDLPAGILQVLNLGQQAIGGVMEEKLVIHTEPDKLLFDHNELPPQSPYKIKVEVRRPGKPGTASNVHAYASQASPWEIVHEKEIQIDVSSNTAPVTDLFAQPISVRAGYVIGTPTYSKAVSLTNDAGLVEFALWPNLSASSKNNGFILIKTKMADDKALYFGFR